MHQMFECQLPQCVGGRYDNFQLEWLGKMEIFPPMNAPFIIGEHCKGATPVLISKQCQAVGCQAPNGTEKLPGTHLPCLLANPGIRAGLSFG